jgi:hypothetical protein
MKRAHICFFFLMCTLLPGCKKENDSPAAPTVYVAGSDGTYMAYWKNDKEVLVSASNGATYINSGFVSGTDVYSAGVLYTTTGSVPAYWKNNIEVNPPYTGEATLNSIFVSGTDVYVAGYDGTSALYWKNGVQATLSLTTGATDAEESSIIVSGSDVYVAGSQMIGGLLLPHTGETVYRWPLLRMQ